MTRKKKATKKTVMSVYTDMGAKKLIEKVMANTGKSRGEVIAEAVAASQDDGNEQEKPAVISVASYIGGVGKTTTVVNLGLSLAGFGYSVLLIDLDEQGSLSQYLRVYDPEAAAPCIADVMLPDKRGNRQALEDVIVPTQFENLDIVPSSLRFANADNIMKDETPAVGLDTRLKRAVDDLVREKIYDIVIIDCPSDRSLVAINAVRALEAGNDDSMIIVPVRPDCFSERGMQETLGMIEEVAKQGGVRVPQCRLLWTMVVRRSSVFGEAKRRVEMRFGKLELFNTRVDKSVRAPESSLNFQPLCVFDPTCVPSVQYGDLAAEVESMIMQACA